MKIGVDPEDLAGVEILGTADPDMYVSIGNGNRKIGLIPSWSLPHFETCNKRLRGHCAKHCYNTRIKLMFPNVWDMWRHNLWMLENHPVLAELLIRKYLYMALPRVMRLHVAGDFYSRDYLDMWIRIAGDNGKTVFYGYSKMDGIDHAKLPDNLRILRSQWPGMPPPRQRNVRRNCWVQDGTETRIPDGAMPCPGDCPKCGFKCAFGEGDVVIALHR